jgi:uncharacterized protein YciI
MGNSKGYVPSEEAKRRVSESLKKAYAEGRHRRRTDSPSDEANQKASETLKRNYAEGRMTLTGAALQATLAPKKSEAERKARKLETQQGWRATHPEKRDEYYAKYHPGRRGITTEKYQEMLEKQGGVCAICKRPESGKRLAIDHDHSCCPDLIDSHARMTCGKCVRGLLCETCNRGLGLFYDSTETLQAAITYLNGYQKD